MPPRRLAVVGWRPMSQPRERGAGPRHRLAALRSGIGEEACCLLRQLLSNKPRQPTFRLAGWCPAAHRSSSSNLATTPSSWRSCFNARSATRQCSGCSLGKLGVSPRARRSVTSSEASLWRQQRPNRRAAAHRISAKSLYPHLNDQGTFSPCLFTAPSLGPCSKNSRSDRSMTRWSKRLTPWPSG